MEKCPVCGKKNETLLCDQCGFDGSMNYEAHPTLAIPSLAARKSEWDTAVKSYKPCDNCGNYQFYQDSKKESLVCVKCKRSVSQAPKILYKTAPAYQSQPESKTSSHSVALKVAGFTLAILLIISSTMVGVLLVQHKPTQLENPTNNPSTPFYSHSSSSTQSTQSTQGTTQSTQSVPTPAGDSEGLAMALNSTGDGYVVIGMGSCTDEDLIIPAEYEGLPVIKIGNAAFANHFDITSVVLPESIVAIGEDAFLNCYSIRSITFPDSLKSIERSAFYFCGIGQLELPISLESIDDYAFSECYSLTEVEIPASVTYIGSSAFSYCDALTSISVDPDNPVYHSRQNCIIETASKTLIAGTPNSVIPTDGSVCIIGVSAFEGSAITEIIIPDTITEIQEFAFYQCRELTKIMIPGNVVRIGYYAFSDSSSLTEIFLEEGVEVIGSNAFSACTSISTITLPESLTTISNSSFADCTQLQSIHIPKSITRFPDDLFANCLSLTDIYYDGTIEQWQAIDKADDWDAEIGYYTIHCIDGDITR